MSNEKILTKDDILQVKDYQVKQVEVPKWGGTVRLKTLSGRERDEFEAKVTGAGGAGTNIDIRGLKALLLSLVIVNEQDELVFSKENIDELNLKSAKTINDLFEVAQKMNGIGEEAVNELLKNSEGNLKDAGGSGLPDK